MSIPVRSKFSRNLGPQEPVRPGHYNNLRSDVINALSSLDVGNDADKESSPDAGRAFVASDTGKLYVALSDGSWTDLSSHVTDPASGDPHTQYLLASGSRALTGDWSAGASRTISVGNISVSNSAIAPTGTDQWAS